MIDKIYDPSSFENEIYKSWLKACVFEASVKDNKKQVYSAVLPPPNVTGSLHLGHAFSYSLQDVIARYKRMCGYDVLYQPGFDHAGIATQMLVEGDLFKNHGLTREDLGRKKFLQKVWKYKEENSDEIFQQLQSLGIGCDWPRQKFTLDQDVGKMVRKAFVTLYDEGLIYLDKRLVSWDTKLKTAISDIEIKYKEQKGSIWNIRYPLYNDTSYVVIATTRPETLLGDTALAVSPHDDRYKSFVGRQVVQPLTGRIINIIADDHVDADFGSGVVKITPGHDFNDFAVAKRHNLKIINLLKADGRFFLNKNEGFLEGKVSVIEDKLDTNIQIHSLPVDIHQFKKHCADIDGKTVLEARKILLDRLDKLGFLESEKEIVNSVPVSDRSGAVIEPYLSTQWYIDVKEMAKSALAEVDNNNLTFVPESHTITYRRWLENIQPWCISRQLWWGHQLPVWYGPDKSIFVAESASQAINNAKLYYKKDEVELVQDEDVLDTWFSSALWPFATLGWSDSSPVYKKYYPNSEVFTGWDIIFFWVSRMVMFGLHFTKKLPFRRVYFNSIVRDIHGNKMSKSRGNGIDPTVMIDKYGADSLRFTSISLSTHINSDIKLSENRIGVSRNFVTKIWNIMRMVDWYKVKPGSIDETTEVFENSFNLWIIEELYNAICDIDDNLSKMRFSDVGRSIQRLAKNEYCDWYLEFCKEYLQEDHAQSEEVRKIFGWSFGILLKILHPFLPFSTEKMWQLQDYQNYNKGALCAQQSWPKEELEKVLKLIPSNKLKKSRQEVILIKQIVTAIRSIRRILEIKGFIDIAGNKSSFELRDILHNFSGIFLRLAKAKINGNCQLAGKVINVPVGTNFCLALTLSSEIDLVAQLKRLEKDSNIIQKQIISLESRLSNDNFLASAPIAIVNDSKKMLKKLKEEYKNKQSIVGQL